MKKSQLKQLIKEVISEMQTENENYYTFTKNNLPPPSGKPVIITNDETKQSYEVVLQNKGSDTIVSKVKDVKTGSYDFNLDTINALLDSGATLGSSIEGEERPNTSNTNQLQSLVKECVREYIIEAQSSAYYFIVNSNDGKTILTQIPLPISTTKDNIISNAQEQYKRGKVIKYIPKPTIEKLSYKTKNMDFLHKPVELTEPILSFLTKS